MPDFPDNATTGDAAPPRAAGRRSFAFLLLLFFLSGAAGLIYQVVWTRRLFLTLGATSLAVATVLTAFMAGLAVGSLAAGRLIDRRKDGLRVYALLELGIGVYGALTPWLFEAAEGVFHAVLRQADLSLWPSYLLRFVLALSILIVPTALMGATLPVLSREVVERMGHVGRRLGLLYGINTLGAAAGVVFTGFFLIPGLGLRLTIGVAVGMNLLVAGMALAWGVVRAGDAPPAAPPGPAAVPAAARGAHRWVLALAALGGFASFLYELAWTRVLTLVLGGAVQAFSVMLSTFLVGLALGSVVLSRRIDRSRDLFLFYAVIEGGVAATALAVLPLFGEMPWLTIRFFPSVGGTPALLTGFWFAVCFLTMIVPCLLIGVTFPVVGALYARDLGSLGRRVGEVYFANTAGGILGAFAGGFVLLPLAGMERTLILASLINAGCAVLAAFLGASPRRRQVRVAAAAAVATVLLLHVYPLAWAAGRSPDHPDPEVRRRQAEERALAPRRYWDPRVVAGGVAVHAADYAKSPDGALFRKFLEERDLLFYEEGHEAVVTVTRLREFPESRSLQVNGKTDASNLSDLPTEILLGALPMLVHPDPGEVLVVGLGSGITAGAVARFEEARRIDVVEIEAAVVRAARLFARDNHDVLPDPARGRPGDPRLALTVMDARHVCAMTPRRYDVVLNQPSNPWLSGPSHLFTLEHFRNLRRVLKDGGLVVQWCQTYGMTPELVRSVAKTFRAAFPHVLVVAYPAQPGNLFLLGSERPVAFDLPRLEARLARPAVREELARIGYDTPARLLAVLARREESGGAGDGIPLNTDDRPVVEFEAPRHLQRDRIREVLAALFGERPGLWPEIAPDPAAAMERLHLRPRIFEAHESLGLAEGAWAAGEEALRADPEDDALRARLGALCFKAWRDAPAGAAAARWRDRARANLEALVGRQSLNGPALEQLGDLASADGRHEEAARRYEEALAAGRRTPGNLVAFGTACARLGRTEDAAKAFDEAVAADPDQHRAWAGLADALLKSGRADLARDALERWLRHETRPLMRLDALRRLETIPRSTPAK